MFVSKRSDPGPFCGSCHAAEYGRFVLQQWGDADAAISLARQAIEGQCAKPAAREVLGVAHYVAWAGASGAHRDESLRQARVFLPAGPWMVFRLAGSEHTIGAVRQLLVAGESIDQRDSNNFNALAYALERKDLAAARRLLRLGARPDAPVGHDSMPAAFLPVMLADVGGIRLMQEFRVDYTKLHFRGISAIDHARRTGNRRLIDALDPHARAS